MEVRFALTDEGRLEYYLGVELEYINAPTLELHQRAFLKKLLARFNMEGCSPKSTPLYVNSIKGCPDVVDRVLVQLYVPLSVDTARSWFCSDILV